MNAAVNPGTTGAAAAMVAQATRASGVIVHVDTENFLRIMALLDQPLVVHGRWGFFTKQHQYPVSYRGLAFYCKSKDEVSLPTNCQVVEAKKIWIPA